MMGRRIQMRQQTQIIVLVALGICGGLSGEAQAANALPSNEHRKVAYGASFDVNVKVGVVVLVGFGGPETIDAIGGARPGLL